MLISLNWLNEYININDLTAESIATTLTDLGLEVEGISKTAPLPAGLVVGRILTAEKHPDADSLQICAVDVGNGKTLSIVCGAPNARAGLIAAVATVDTILPGDFKIKTSKIRGIQSDGMMCSKKELGLSEENSGLWELPQHWQIGQPVAQFFKTDDQILELNVTPNRADCLSYIGVARDLAAKLNRPLKIPHAILSTPTTEKFETKDVLKVEVEGDLSLRFCALAIRNIPSSTSPLWMQNRLQAGGMRPINLIVDITNYVLLEYGQPIHAYDETFLQGKLIQVRSASLKDELIALDGTKLNLSNDDIVIADAQKPVGLAGIMGGANSEVKDHTKDIIVEVAEFSASKIRKSSKRLGLHTEASHRFERGIDIDAIPTVAQRVAYLIVECCKELGLSAPNVAASAIDFYPQPKKRSRIAIELASFRQMLSMPLLSMDTCIQHLESLNIKLLDKKDHRMVFEIPSWRQDITREVDLIEEVARLIGFDKIPYEQPKMVIAPTPENPIIWFTEETKQQLAQLGLSEVITFPFVAKNQMSMLGIPSHHPLNPSLELANPISDEYQLMQTSLLPGLLEAVIKNRNRGHKGSKLFEIGKGYFNFKAKPIDKTLYPNFASLDRMPMHYTERAKKDSLRPTERQIIGIVLDQPYLDATWNTSEVATNFYHMKKIVVNLMHSLGANPANLTLIRPNIEEFPFLHPGAAAIIQCENKYLGWIGEVHPRVALKLGFTIDQIPLVGELDLERLYEFSKIGRSVIAESSKFPAVKRDIALLVNNSVTHAMFEDSFASFKKANLTEVKLFDVYTGSNLPENKKSFAYTASFQSTTKTLTDKEVDKEVEMLIKWLKEKLDAEQR